MGGGKKNENENGRKREFATDPRSKRAREKNTPFGHTPHSDFGGFETHIWDSKQHFWMPNTIFGIRNTIC